MKDCATGEERAPAPIESRDPRFAELDARIKAEDAERQQKHTAERTAKRKGAGRALPREVRKEVTHCARQLRQHRQLFIADPKLKERAARFLRSLLPPKRKRGRPGIDSVTNAIQLRNRFRRQYPGEKAEQIWKRIYPEAIPGYADMDRERQKAERLLLRDRVRSRRTQQRKLCRTRFGV